MAVFQQDTGIFSPIPASLDPITIDDQLWRAVAKDCRRILSAMKKVVTWLRQTPETGIARELFGHLGTLESDAAFGRLGPNTGLATARFDLFFDGEDLRILEVNATIPAMQAYGDMVRDALAASFAATSAAESLRARTTSSDLLAALLHHYDASGGRIKAPRIGIIARSGDSQITELEWLRSAWQALGHEVLIGTPEDVELAGEALTVKRTPVDLVYRHVFAHRLVDGSPFAEACRRSRTFFVFNPVSAHLEVKALLAETSRLAADEASAAATGLSDEEIEAIRRRVPWTRVVRPADAPLMHEIGSLAPHDLVLKTSSGYGGHGVMIGQSMQDPAVAKRLRDPGTLWIAQRRVPGKILSHRVLARDGSIGTSRSYFDCSLFTGDLDDSPLPGGAARFASDPIVNIGRGGGLAPLLLQSEAVALKLPPLGA